MDTVRTYILSVTAAAVLCGLVTALTGKSGTLSTIMKLISGIVMASVVIQPFGSAISADLKDYFLDLNAQTTAAVLTGTEAYTKELASRIKQETESYILDKAESLEADLSVEIRLNNDEIPIPVGVVISGSVSPYAKTILQELIWEDLGIPKEEQIWN